MTSQTGDLMVVNRAGTDYKAKIEDLLIEKEPDGNASQNISGNLTLGTDKITLDATDGSILAEGSIRSGAFSYTENAEGSLVANTGGILAKCKFGDTTKTAFGVIESTDNNTSGTFNSYLLFDGSATFAKGNVEIQATGATIVKGPGAFLSVEKNQTDNSLGMFAVHNDNGSSDNLSFLVNGNGAYVGTGGADGSNSKIALDATNGSATFAGNLGIGTPAPVFPLVVSDNGNAGIEISPSQGVQGGPIFQSYDRAQGKYTPISYFGTEHVFGTDETGATSDESVRINKNGNLLVGDSGTLNPKVSINHDGSASFAGGDITLSADGVIDATSFRYGAGALYLSGSPLISSLTPFSNIIYNGSSSPEDGTYFAKTPLASVSDLTALMANDGSFRLGGTLPEFPNIELKSDGSASLAGDVSVGAVICDRDAVTKGTFHSKLNGAYTRIQYADGRDVLYDGSGDLDTANEFYRLESSGTMRTKGEINIYLPIDSFDVNDPKITLNTDGSAHFVGDVTSNGTIGFNLEADNPDNYTTTTEEYEDTITGPGGRIEKTVTRTREIKTYTGPVLDVKAELQALRERATQQDVVIAQMTAALRELGKEVASMPTSGEQEPKTTRKRKS